MSVNAFNTLRRVLVNPARFFEQMPREGGYLSPVLFVVQVALISAVLSAVVELFVAGVGSAFTELLQALVALPVYALFIATVFSLAFALLWKLMGSQQGFEVAFRCVAYSFALFPVWVLLSEQHAVLQWLVLAIGIVLLAIASEKVHSIEKLNARVAMVVIAAVTAIFFVHLL